ncbi:MAG: M20/M25/M40 family metallo-hydrolase [Anaerolineales bacterium]
MELFTAAEFGHECLPRHNGTEPTDISPCDGPEYAIIVNAIRQHYPHFKAVAPFLMIAATDSRVYHGLAEGVYRLSPFEISEEDLQTVHADNERIKIANFFKGIEFFKTLLVNATMK